MLYALTTTLGILIFEMLSTLCSWFLVPTYRGRISSVVFLPMSKFLVCKFTSRKVLELFWWASFLRHLSLRYPRLKIFPLGPAFVCLALQMRIVAFCWDAASRHLFLAWWVTLYWWDIDLCYLSTFNCTQDSLLVRASREDKVWQLLGTCEWGG